MTSSVGLHELIGSVAGAIVDAQGIVERHYLDLLGRYFDAEGRPISLGIKVPSTAAAAGANDHIQLAIPLLSLVESRLLAIKEMKIALDVELGDIADTPAPAVPGHLGAPLDVPAIAAPAGPQADAAPIAQPNTAPPAKMLTVGVGSRGDSGGPMAKLSITVEAAQPSEGLCRLLTQLNKVV
ncbi:MAG: DUF2589 domain-containing protein [Sphingomonas sp.]